MRVQLSTTGVVLWSGVLLFLLVWIFALGILVGRGSLPGEIRGVAELKEQMGRLHGMISRDKVEEGGSGATLVESPKLAFYDTLAVKKEEARDQKPERPKIRPKDPARREAPLSTLPAVPERLDPSFHASSYEEGGGPAFEEKTGDPKMPGDVPEKETVVEAALPAPESVAPRRPESDLLFVKAQYTVQVASMESREAAEEMIARLNRKGYPSYYYDVTIGGKTHYRVRCGRFLSRAEAENHAVLLAGKEGIHGFVSKLE